MKVDLKEMQKEAERIIELERKLDSLHPFSEEDEKDLKQMADEGSPRMMFDYGVYLFRNAKTFEDMNVARSYLDKAKKDGNAYLLFRMSHFYACVNDQEESMSCLKRAAWRKHPIAIRMLKTMKENPFVDESASA